MTFSLYPEGVSHTDETMPTSSAKFLEQLRQCTDETSRQQVRDAIRMQACSLVQQLGGYGLETQVETIPLSDQF